MSKQVLLLILDGWGLNQDYPGNAVARAKTPHFDKLWKDQPTAVLQASGESVGLPEGQMGTSEVNHFTIGAGRIVFQDLVRINRAIADGSFFKNEMLISACQHAVANQSALHILGLVSDGGVHSHIDHLIALVKLAKQHKVKKVFIHGFTDGRDTSPHGSLEYVPQLEDALKELKCGQLVSLVGRYYAMDRDKHWDRTQKAVDLLTQGRGSQYDNAVRALSASHAHQITDEYIEPIWLSADTSAAIQANDSVIFANFRNDRPRQLTEKLRELALPNLLFTTMTQYKPEYGVPIAFSPISSDHTLGEVVAAAGKTQLRMTETEKFAHVTFFFNCKREEPYESEDRLMLDTHNVRTHDEKPEMRALDIAQQLVTTLKNNQYDLIVVNICNADMVGHTGNIDAAIRACEAVDQALGMIVPVAKQQGYHTIITADHGNADEMIDQATNEILTQHSLNPVPLIVVSPTVKQLNRSEGLLSDIAPTILKLMGLSEPIEMTGTSLI